MPTLSSPISSLLDKAVAGERLTPEEGLAILKSHDLTAIGAAADAVHTVMISPISIVMMR